MANNGEVTKIRSKNILIVDDDRETCELLSMLFHGRGYHATTALGGREALQRVEQQPPDVVLLDLMMPEMDGWETFRQIRSLADTPVLFLTAMSSGDLAARALQIGADDYVRKPYHPEELLSRIETLLSRTADSKNKRQTGLSMPMERPTVSVIIPTLNEADNIPLVLPFIPLDYVDEVVLVDGRSTDGTIDAARRMMPSINVVLEDRPGKGAALRAGYEASNGDVIVVVDADGSHDPREIPRFVQALIEGADFAKGSRFAPGGGTTDMPRLRQWGNRFFTLLVNQLFNVCFTDLCYGYHAFWRYCLNIFSLGDVDGFEIDTAIYLRALHHRLKVTEVASFEGYRFQGTGKLKTFPDGWRVLRTIAKESLLNIRKPCKENYLGFRGRCPDEPKTQLQTQPISYGMWNVDGNPER